MSGAGAGGSRRLVLGVALFVLALLVTACVLSVVSTRSRLTDARHVCASIVPGTSRAAAESTLTAWGAVTLGWFGTLGVARAPSVSYGRRGTVASWECDVSYDPLGVVTGATFTWWIPPDFHGRWDDRPREWIEANLL